MSKHKSGCNRIIDCGENCTSTEDHEVCLRSSLIKVRTQRDELLEIAKLILKEWEAPTEGVQRGELIARLSQYAAEARAAIRKAEAP